MLPAIMRRVRRHVAEHDLIRPGELVLAGVSGGPDSVFLLAALRLILPGISARLHALHLDHCLRGEESAGDARFVRDLCAGWGVPCTVEVRPVSALPEDGTSVQEKARKVRMSFFSRMKEDLGAQRIALGHTADDQAETILMRLIAGGGPGALAGIQPVGSGGIIHPLLETTKASILMFLAKENIAYRNDHTNNERKYLRNRVRLDVLPAVRVLNPAFHRRAAEIGALLREDSRCLDRLADEAYRKILRRDHDGLGLPLDELSALPPAIQRRIILRCARESGVSRKNFRAVHMGALLSLLKGPPGRRLVLPGNRRAARIGRMLVFREVGDAPALVSERAVALPGVTFIPELSVTIESAMVPPPDVIPHSGETAFIDADTIAGTMRVRTRREGDRFHPLGLGHSRKLKKFLIDLKIERERRDRIPIIEDDEKIVWVGGLRLDDRVRITPSTTRVWRLQLRREGAVADA